MSALLQRGADVDAVDDNGWTALHIACQLKFEKTVVVLVAAGANINLRNGCGDAACQLACLVSPAMTDKCGWFWDSDRK